MRNELKIKIIDEDENGNGIARIDNFVVFVYKGLLDEIVLIKINKNHKRFAFAEIVKIIDKSDRRIDEPCNCYFKCGGCQFQHINNDDEINKKIKRIQALFPNIKVNETIFTNNKEYRNKVTFHVVNNKLGYYEPQSNDLITFDHCNLLSPRINELYHYLEHQDLSGINNITIRELDNKILISIDGKTNIDIPNIDSLYINNELIYGKKLLSVNIDKYKYVVNNTSFLQVNTNKMKLLYDLIKEKIKATNNLLDLYCGTGTIGIYLSNKFNSITGIDIGDSNIELANINKSLNKINNISFIKCDAEKIKSSNYDTVIVDPPRNGLGKKVINILLEINPKQIIYVSCNPKTLKNDLILLEAKYEIIELNIVDMFPKTSHVECVAVLNLK